MMGEGDRLVRLEELLRFFYDTRRHLQYGGGINGAQDVDLVDWKSLRDRKAEILVHFEAQLRWQVQEPE